jgi:hypothetical protein
MEPPLQQKRAWKSRAKTIPPASEGAVEGVDSLQVTTATKKIRKPRTKKSAASLIGVAGLEHNVTTPSTKTAKKPRRKKIPLTTEDVQTTQTVMPESDSPNDIGPPLPESTSALQNKSFHPFPCQYAYCLKRVIFVHELLLHVAYVYTCLGRLKNGRFMKEQKGKAHLTKARKPRGWVPATVPPNPTVGVETRARKSLVREYKAQRENDDTIREVLVHFEGGDFNILPTGTALESHYKVGSFDNYIVDLWKSVFRDDAWRSVPLITKAIGFRATHPEDSLPKPISLIGIEVPHHLRDLYADWSTERAGWAVLVPNRLLSEASFYTGYIPSWI